METNFKNKTIMERAKHDKNNTYTVILNDLIRDERLNVTEVGIMVRILTNDETKYVFNSIVMQKTSGIPRGKYFDAIKNLKKYGYIDSKALRGGGVCWVIREQPMVKSIIVNENITIETNIIEDNNIEKEEIIEKEVIEETIENIPTKEIDYINDEDEVIERFNEYLTTKNNGKYDTKTDTINNICENFSHKERQIIKKELDNFNITHTLKQQIKYNL